MTTAFVDFNGVVPEKVRLAFLDFHLSYRRLADSDLAGVHCSSTP